MKVTYSRKAQRQLRKFSSGTQLKIQQKLSEYAEAGGGITPNTGKIHCTDNAFRMKVGLKYRVVFYNHGDEIHVAEVFHRQGFGYTKRMTA